MTPKLKALVVCDPNAVVILWNTGSENVSSVSREKEPCKRPSGPGGQPAPGSARSACRSVLCSPLSRFCLSSEFGREKVKMPVGNLPVWLMFIEVKSRNVWPSKYHHTLRGAAS